MPESVGEPVGPHGGWTKHTDPHGRGTFYYLHTTGETTWVRPPEMGPPTPPPTPHDELTAALEGGPDLPNEADALHSGDVMPWVEGGVWFEDNETKMPDFEEFGRGDGLSYYVKKSQTTTGEVTSVVLYSFSANTMGWNTLVVVGGAFLSSRDDARSPAQFLFKVTKLASERPISKKKYLLPAYVMAGKLSLIHI